jgi:Flp pilus assembly pilin Flp
MDRIIRVLKDESGIEMLEWILVGGIITGAAVALYVGVLQPGLDGALQQIVAAITAQMP